MDKVQYEEERRKYWQKLGPYREILNSPVGQEFLKFLKQRVLNPPEGIYVAGSFDKTAFNLGRMSLVSELDDLARGPIDER